MVKINGERMTRGEEAALENGQRRSLAWVSEAGKAPAVGGAGEVNTALKTCKFLDTLLSPFLFPFVCPCHVLFCNPPQTLGDDAPGGQVLGPAPRCGIQCCQDFWALKELLGNSEGGGPPRPALTPLLSSFRPSTAFPSPLGPMSQNPYYRLPEQK